MNTVEQKKHVARLGDAARDLGKLTEHPSWKLLRDTFEKARADAELRLANELFSGGEGAKPADQRKIDYRRGFLRGCQAVLDHPERAVKAFEEAMERMEQGG